MRVFQWFLLIMLLLVLPAAAQVKFVNASAPANAGDIINRLLVAALDKECGLSSIVENKPGASGEVAVMDVFNAKQKENILLFGSVTLQIGFAADTVMQMPPVAVVATTPLELITSEKYPTFDSLMAMLKTGQGKYATIGQRTMTTMATLDFEEKYGFKSLMVLYKASKDGMLDLSKGDVDYFFAPRAAIGGLPVVVLPGHSTDIWYALFASPGISDARLTFLARSIEKARASPIFIEGVSRVSGDVLTWPRTTFAQEMVAFAKKYENR